CRCIEPHHIIAAQKTRSRLIALYIPSGFELPAGGIGELSELRVCPVQSVPTPVQYCSCPEKITVESFLGLYFGET
ncbi:MAG TPA: hypothetical protein VGI78_20620, partial [Acetobacteraceae bacterium]